MNALPFPLGPGLVVRRLRLRPGDVVFVKGIIEANQGIATLFAEQGGEVTIASPASRARELDELLEDLSREVAVVRTP